jgi:hypothetical protein
VPGNHEYESPGAAPYFAYFGEAAGPPGVGYYSFTAGDWLILMLNSNVPATRGSPQWEFARVALERQQTPCTMAVWHHPLFSSGPNGNTPAMRDLWELLETHRAEIVFSGHDHLYERFARQLSNGTADPVNGIRQIIAGTGGADRDVDIRVLFVEELGAGLSEGLHGARAVDRDRSAQIPAAGARSTVVGVVTAGGHAACQEAAEPSGQSPSLAFH